MIDQISTEFCNWQETSLAEQFIECRKRHDKDGMLAISTRLVDTQEGTSELTSLYDDGSITVMNKSTGKLFARKRLAGDNQATQSDNWFAGIRYRNTNSRNERLFVDRQSTWSEIVVYAYKRNKSLSHSLFAKLNKTLLDSRDGSVLYKFDDDNSYIVHVESSDKYLLPYWQRSCRTET